MTEPVQYVNNMGIAAPKVMLYSYAPLINKSPKKFNFDISAEIFPTLLHSPYFPPLLAECAVDTVMNSFSVIYPSKRKLYVSNFLMINQKASSSLINWKNENAGMPYITWTPLSAVNTTSGTAVTDFLKNFDTDVTYDPSLAGTPTTNQTAQTTETAPAAQLSASNYSGPVWVESKTEWPAPPNDDVTISEFWKAMRTSEEEKNKEQEKQEVKEEKIVTLNSISQTRIRDGLWWGVESNAFITNNMPFWVNIQRNSPPPTKSTHPTTIIISFGLNSKDQRYDLFLQLDSKPRLYDYTVTEQQNVKRMNGSNKASNFNNGGNQPAPYRMMEWNVDLARVLSSEKNIEVGIMSSGGRLIIHINKIPLVYTRVESESGDANGTLKIAKIIPGRVRVVGTNISASINACPMTFATQSMLALAIPNIGTKQWSGVNCNGEPEGNVSELPHPSSSPKLYGVDCYEFKSETGTSRPNGEGFLKKGKITFGKSEKEGFDFVEKKFYVVSMQPFDGNMASADGNKYLIKNSGCPFFFRIKGMNTTPPSQAEAGTDITDYVLSIDESAAAQDYFHVKKTATITVYNKNGVFNHMDVISKTAQEKAIRIWWSWNTGGIRQMEATFTGLITSIAVNESPGMETLTFSCEDYSHVLKNTPIVNSPFYDGMVGAYVIKDLAERAGCIEPDISGFQNANTYFLPSGFAFTKPAVRWSSEKIIESCILETVKRFEAYYYFDGMGKFILKKLPGGLFSTPSSYEAEIQMDPKQTRKDVDQVILGEKIFTMDLNSTVNVISIRTLERDTKNAIFTSTTAPYDRLLFRKILLIDQAAYGEVEVARKYGAELGKRVFHPILKTSFKTVGGRFLSPLAFVRVLGHPFRIMSFKRNFSAENNDFSQSAECEWLGGT